MKQKKIMFVCMGNICRSPLAHGVFQRMVTAQGLGDHFEIESSGTTGYHVGEMPDHRMSQTAHSHGYDLNHRARRFMPHDLEDFDLILPMDKENMQDILRHVSDKNQVPKVKLFRDFDPQGYPGSEVPDPYYGGAEGFENVFDIVERTSKSLLELLKEELEIQ